MTRLLLIDNDPLYLELLRDILEGYGFEVVCAQDGSTALSQLAQQIPDLILCEAVLPGIDGYTLLDTVRQTPAYAQLPMLLVSVRGGVNNRVMALRRGADAFLTKPFEPEELVAHIQAILRRVNHSSTEKSTQSLPRFTPMEEEILKHLILGKSNKVIAEQMGIARRTVEGHIRFILMKTGLHNRTELTHWALKVGLG
ncbi:response regulator transcription factor [Anthocerotibacter panamensis]|uniref:response regulator transcription factor n=1 Tax=Anthocerotibacter panamensis TaxID=2857077 RepID=UPI001C405FC7|nr:response regulator transcription factor [Anthocerotibacter panamensis]